MDGLTRMGFFEWENMPQKENGFITSMDMAKTTKCANLSMVDHG